MSSPMMQMPSPGMMTTPTTTTPTKTAPPPTTTTSPIVPLPLKSSQEFGAQWKTCTCEKKINVLTKAQTPDRISQVLSDVCGLYIAGKILKTSEVICAGKLKTNGSVCL